MNTWQTKKEGIMLNHNSLPQDNSKDNIFRQNIKGWDELSDDDKQITMVFILYDKNSGLSDMVATITLGDLVKIVYSEEHLKSAENHVKKFPKDQIKSGIKIRDFIKNNKDSVKIIWKK